MERIEGRTLSLGDRDRVVRVFLRRNQFFTARTLVRGMRELGFLYFESTSGVSLISTKSFNRVVCDLAAAGKIRRVSSTRFLSLVFDVRNPAEVADFVCCRCGKETCARRDYERFRRRLCNDCFDADLGWVELYNRKRRR